MARSLAVCHGPFGRATLNRLKRPLVSHAHREGHIIITLRGTGCHIESQGARLPLVRGQAVLIDPWQPHQFEPCPDKAAEFLTLYIEPDWFSTVAETALVFGRSRVDLSARMESTADDLAALLQCDAEQDELNEDLSKAREEAVAQLAGALHATSHSALTERQDERSGDGYDTVASPRSIGDFRIRRALRLLRQAAEEDSAQAMDLDAVARAAGLSRPHFFKLFNECVGMTPGTYLNALKMERSYRRLATSADSVTAIGLDLGFASQASFTRFFTANCGIPPTRYRQAVADHFDLDAMKQTLRYV